jgi:hypothetical protein
MLVMLDTSHDLRECAAELGCEVEQLLTPLTRFKLQEPDQHFAIDNGAYSGFRSDDFLALLKREDERRKLCRFVSVPDVVGSAIRTCEVFEFWQPRLQRWPLAFVAQDGQENHPIPWNRIAAVFIGGTTQFKMGPHTETIIRAAQAIGKWVHVGRVNTPGRFEYFEKLGADSIDGTGLSRYSWMRENVNERRLAPTLFTEEVA